MKTLLLASVLALSPIMANAANFYEYLAQARVLAIAAGCQLIPMGAVGVGAIRLRPHALNMTEITMLGLSESLGYGDAHQPGVCAAMQGNRWMSNWITTTTAP